MGNTIDCSCTPRSKRPASPASGVPADEADRVPAGGEHRGLLRGPNHRRDDGRRLGRKRPLPVPPLAPRAGPLTLCVPSALAAAALAVAALADATRVVAAAAADEQKTAARVALGEGWGAGVLA
eukprot:1194270-Prorocentrum_minimum.AAC.7